MSKLFAVLIVIIAAVHQGSANLKCYECTSSSPQDSCYDPSSSKDLKPSTCSDSLVNKIVDYVKSAVSDGPLTPVCLKSRIRVGSELLIRRECNSINSKEILTLDKCQTIVTQTLGGQVEYCGVCDSDGCNPASVVRSPTFLALLVLLAFLYTIL